MNLTETHRKQKKELKAKCKAEFRRVRRIDRTYRERFRQAIKERWSHLEQSDVSKALDRLIGMVTLGAIRPDKRKSKFYIPRLVPIDRETRGQRRRRLRMEAELAE